MTGGVTFDSGEPVMYGRSAVRAKMRFPEVELLVGGTPSSIVFVGALSSSVMAQRVTVRIMDAARIVARTAARARIAETAPMFAETLVEGGLLPAEFDDDPDDDGSYAWAFMSHVFGQCTGPVRDSVRDAIREAYASEWLVAAHEWLRAPGRTVVGVVAIARCEGCVYYGTVDGGVVTLKHGTNPHGGPVAVDTSDIRAFVARYGCTLAGSTGAPDAV